MADTYLKYIELAVDDFESQIINEINCANNEHGKARIEKLRKDAERCGRAGIIVRVQAPDMTVLS